MVTVGAFHGGLKHNIISDRAEMQLTVRANDAAVRRTLLDGIRRIALNVGRMNGMAEDRLPEVRVSTESTPPTINHAETAARVGAAFAGAFGAGTVLEPQPQTGMGAEDFAYFIQPEHNIRGVYFEVGGTPQAALDAERNGGPPVPAHHSPFFRIAPEPSVTPGHPGDAGRGARSAAARRGAVRAALTAALLLATACGTPDEKRRDQSAEDVANQLAGLAIEPGLWETSSEVVGVSAPDLPFQVQRRMIGPRPSSRACITPEQAARPDANFLAARAGGRCSYRDFSMQGGRIGGAMTCPEPGLPRPTEATMQGRYEPRAYALDMRMEMAMPDGALMVLEVRGRGRRIGHCPPAPTKGEG